LIFAESNRLEHARHGSVSRSLKAHIASLRKALAALEAEIAACLKASETLGRKARLMQTLKGLDPATVTAILAYMPEIGSFTKAGAALMADLAPINDDSGKLNGPRHIEAGRASVRKALYMAPRNLSGTASLARSSSLPSRSTPSCIPASLGACANRLTPKTLDSRTRLRG
jgi:transposase